MLSDTRINKNNYILCIYIIYNEQFFITINKNYKILYINELSANLVKKIHEQIMVTNLL